MNTHHGDTEARSSSCLLSESLTETIIGAAIEVHRRVGPGLLEISLRGVHLRKAWNHVPGSMIPKNLCASVSPWWVFCVRRLSA